MDESDIIKMLGQLKDVADYFSKKTLKGITFRDADNYDYEIHGLFQKWQKVFPDRDFKKEFPTFDLFWEELATWNYEDEWNREKCEKIIDLAKKASLEIQNYIAELSK